MSDNSKFLIIKKLKKTNWWIFCNALLIYSISLLTIYSATITKGTYFFKRELVWGIAAVLVYIVFTFIDYRNYEKYYKYIYALNIILLLSVLIFGTTKLGAKRWLDFKFFMVQPSEFSKLFVVLTLSSFLKLKYSERFTGFKAIVLSFAHILPVFILIAVQPDLGTSIVILAIYVILIFINGIDWRTIIMIFLGTIMSIPLVYNFLLKDYQKTRILTFLNPESDLLGSGWNVMQSMIAIGSGSMYGKGFLKSTQSKLKFLPEAHTDFIGAVFLEERGFVGGCILFTLYALLIYQIMLVAETTEDRFGKLICYGISSIFFIHFVINVGMIMGIMPVTGLPLLIMSYGGTSLVFAFTMLGIVHSVKIYRGM